MLPSVEEMDLLAIDAKIRKAVADNMDEFKRMLVSDIIDGFSACRISKDGKVTFLTKEQYDELWQNSEKSGE